MTNDTTLPVDEGTMTGPLVPRTVPPPRCRTLSHDAGPPLWQFIRGPKLRLEVCAQTRAGDPARHANQDGAAVIPLAGGGALIAVADAVTFSFGVESCLLRDRVLMKLRASVDAGLAEPALLMAQVQADVLGWLPGAGVRTGLALAVVTIAPSGRYTWASVGDAVLFHQRPRARFKRPFVREAPRLRRLNVPGRAAHENRLTASIGQLAPLCVEAGAGVLAAGHLLLAGSDGAMPFGDEALAPVLDAYLANLHLFTLANLMGRIDVLASEHETYTDDRTLVAVRAIEEQRA